MAYFIPQREKRDLTPEEVLSDAHGEIARRIEKPINPRNFFFFALLLGIGMVVLLGQAMRLMILHYNAYAKIAESNRTKRVVVPPRRGIVYDRNGAALMRNIPVFDLVASPLEFPEDRQETLRNLSAIAELSHLSPDDERHYKERLETSPQKPFLVAERLDSKAVVLFSTREKEFPGFSLRLTPSRRYAEPEALYHILGLLGRASEKDVEESGYLVSDLVGKDGIEASYEGVLKGAYGEELYEVNARGEVMRLLSRKEPVEGNAVVLAIDQHLQAYAYRQLLQAVRARNSPGGAVVAVDPRDGRILALVSAPSVDANSILDGISQSAYQKLLEDPHYPFFNRAVSARYPAGSTLKPFLGAAALAEGIVTPRTVIQDNGAITIADIYNPSIIYTFRGYAALGPMDIASAIAFSSDIYFYTIGGGYGAIRGLGVERIEAYLQKFGFGKTLGIDIPGEDEGLIPTPAYKEAQKGEKWRIGDTYNISIGQGDVGVTPLQLAMGTAAIANNGTLWKPRLALRVIDKDFNTLETYEPRVLRKDVVSPEHIAVIKKAMRDTVRYGTAKALQQLPVETAAKTGTAQTGKTSKTHSLVTVFAPYDAPEIVLAVIVEKAGEGGEVAVPLARDILMEYFKPQNE